MCQLPWYILLNFSSFDLSHDGELLWSLFIGLRGNLLNDFRETTVRCVRNAYKEIVTAALLKCKSEWLRPIDLFVYTFFSYICMYFVCIFLKWQIIQY